MTQPDTIADKPDKYPGKLGKYDVRGVLGRGSMGTVYDGWDPVIDRQVAIKTVGLLDDDDPDAQEAVARFRKEAQAAGRLTHAGIVAVYDYGETADTAYIVMEFVQGRTLQDRLDAGPPPPLAETARIMEQVLTALQYIHGRGVIHRDIKPSNVMITAEGTAKLTDFGIARIESSSMTRAGTILGTPAYMSPEQLTAQPTDARSDIYAAGVLLYQLLTGKRPFEGGLAAIVNKALNTVPPPPSTIRADAPPALDAVVATAMARNASDRYPTAAAFARALQEALAGPPVKHPRSETDEDLDVDRTIVRRPASHRPAGATPPGPLPTPPLIPGTAPAPRFTIAPALPWIGAAVLVALAGGTAWRMLRPPPVPQKLVQQASPPVPGPGLAPPGSAPADRTPALASPDPRAAPAAATSSTPAVVTSAPQAEPRAAVAPPVPAVAPTPNRMAPAAVRDALARLTVSVFCALPRFSVSDDGRVAVSGPVGAGVADSALREAVTSAAPGAMVTWETRPISGVYCGVLDAVRAIAQPSGPALDLGMADGVTRLPESTVIRPVVRMPDFPAYLMLDYYASDGTVLHLLPASGSPHKPEAPNATVQVLDRLKQRLESGPPFGTDAIVAIASSVPLFPSPPTRRDESARDYLGTLTTAIEAAQRRGAKLAGRVLLLDLEAR